MLVYADTVGGFLDDVLDDSIVEAIRMAYAQRGLGTNPNEVRSWQNSFQYVHKVLAGSAVPDDAGVAIEFQIPLTSKRVDLLLSGTDDAGRTNTAVIELKQWDADATEALPGRDGVVKTYIGGGLRETTHPSYQVLSYTQFLRDFNRFIEDADIHVHPMAYLHNFERSARELLEQDVYRRYVERAPLFLQGEARRLRRRLEGLITVGDGGATIRAIDDSELRPARSLQDAIAEMLDGNDAFTLIDSQKVVFEQAMELIERSHLDGQKRVLVVEGGPGTGKTVVAVSILAQAIQDGYVAQYTSKNAAPREVYERKLRGDMLVKEINHLFTGAGSFVDAAADSLPAVVADEAHRLNASSNFFGRGENQIMEIINAARCAIFFIDESQRIHIDDIGSVAEIRQHAEALGAELLFAPQLEAQFRCSGSTGYTAWVDDVLGIRETANATGFDLDYDIRVCDSPEKLHTTIAERDAEAAGVSRVVAGYCWEWDTERRDDPEHMDIEIGPYRRSWNLSAGGPWAIGAGSLDQVGCIHTCQGLEFAYVGVIIGPDLQYRDGRVVVDYTERASTDYSLRGIKKLANEDPEAADALADELIKNTYRTLMTRGLQGCYLYVCDPQLKTYLRGRIAGMEVQG
jgi:DUF2075 family protein